VTALQDVLANPGSLAARKALLAEWQAQRDPRAELLDKQLAYRELVRSIGASAAKAIELRKQIVVLVRDRGRAFAGKLASLVDDYQFVRGLVATVELAGNEFPRVAEQLFRLAPIERVILGAPLGDVAAIARSPFLGKLVSLSISNHGDAFGDRGAQLLADSAHAAALRSIDLWNDAIGEAGVEALAASPYLRQTAYIGFKGNPADPTPWVNDYDGVPTSGRPALADRLEAKFGPRPWLTPPPATAEGVAAWPPDFDELGVTP
jgi:hypothetical protein